MRLKKKDYDMGEIAEMMLDGTMCAGCGEFLNDGYDGEGYPEYCAACAPDYVEDYTTKKTSAKKLQKSSESWGQSISDSCVGKLDKAHQSLYDKSMTNAEKNKVKNIISTAIKEFL
jgi:hypothetical protein